MGTIVIHAGMPKAGSSSVQNWLRGNASELLESHGIRLVAAVADESAQTVEILPRTDRDIKSDDLAKIILRKRSRGPEFMTSLAQGLEREAARHRTIVLTGEGLAHPLWRLEEAFLHCLDDLASRHRVRIAYYVRAQHEALESAWRQWGFRAGRSPAEYLYARGRSLHYFETYTEVRARAPRVSFEPRPFRGDLLTGGSVAADFAHRFLEIEGDASHDDRTWSNRGLPLEVANLLQAAPAGLFWEDAHDNPGLNAIKRLVRELDLPEREETQRSRRILQAYCHETYEPGNARLAAALGWNAGDLVPAPDPEVAQMGGDLGELDDLWRPHASEAELQLLWRSLSSALASGPNGFPAREAAASNARRRRYSARPRLRGRRLFLDLELGIGDAGAAEDGRPQAAHIGSDVVSSRLKSVRKAVRSPGPAARRARKMTIGRWRTPPFPPNYLIVGAQKAGTRWLRHNLDQHPHVFAASSEIWYFNQHFDRGLDWYRSQFRGWWGEPMVGESSPGYMMWRSDPSTTARRIDEELPGVRIFAVLRDPCDRTLSAFVHHMDRGRVSPGQDLLDYVSAHDPERDPLQLIAGGWYAASLAPFRERFGSRLRVFLNDDIRADPRGVYRSALEHLAVDSSFVPEELAEVRFSNPTPAASGYGLPEGGRRSLTAEERAALYPSFAEDIARLEQMLGRDLSAWGPGEPASPPAARAGEQVRRS